MAFAKRIINLQFRLGAGDFGTKGQNVVDVTGLRASANISKAGTASNAQCDLWIWGMPLDLMNKLTVLNKIALGQQINNSVIVSAGDELGGVSVVFQGTIMEAWADGRNLPDMVFQVSATSGMFQLLKPVPPTSYKGTVDAAVALSGIATQMGLQLANNGVTALLSNPYWPGTLKQQLEKICTAANCIHHIDEANHQLIVWPKGQARTEGHILLSASTGMVGYPAFTQNGLRIRSLYNPNLTFGRRVKVESQLAAASGDRWSIAAVSHNLDANMPGGSWFTEIECGLFGAPTPIIN